VGNYTSKSIYVRFVSCGVYNIQESFIQCIYGAIHQVLGLITPNFYLLSLVYMYSIYFVRLFYTLLYYT